MMSMCLRYKRQLKKYQYMQERYKHELYISLFSVIYGLACPLIGINDNTKRQDNVCKGVYQRILCKIKHSLICQNKVNNIKICSSCETFKYIRAYSKTIKNALHYVKLTNLLSFQTRLPKMYQYTEGTWLS